MCKEDVRIKRSTATNTVKITDGSGAFNAVFPANPNRVAIVLGYVFPPNLGGGSLAQLYAGPTNAAAIMGGISNGQPSNVLRIEDLGQLITYPVYLSSWDGNNAPVTVTEVFFTESLDRV